MLWAAIKRKSANLNRRISTFYMFVVVTFGKDNYATSKGQ
nr:MAG TPA: hypothetical protein [Caudoviricetes sp.]